LYYTNNQFALSVAQSLTSKNVSMLTAQLLVDHKFTYFFISYFLFVIRKFFC